MSVLLGNRPFEASNWTAQRLHSACWSAEHRKDVLAICRIWGWININYHQKWVGEHPHKDYSIHFWDVHQGYLVLTHSHLAFFVFFLTCYVYLVKYTVRREQRLKKGLTRFDGENLGRGKS